MAPLLLDDLARLILPSLHREYPSKLAHVLHGDGDARPPRALTPAFYGCFDWHSAVHSHWAVARLLRLRPDAAWANDARAALARGLTDDAIAGELAYARPRPGFEMPYGAAWLLALAAELAVADDARWAAALRPLEELVAERFAAWLGRLTHPLRSGEHGSSAFAMGLALDYARARGRAELADTVERAARRLYEGDRDAPLAYEPSAYDFLSPALAEAALMARVLPAPAFAAWLAAFAPRLELAPVVSADQTDGKLAHFDGLALSRAWMLAHIAAALPAGDARAPSLRQQASDHAAAGLAAVRAVVADPANRYASAHWLGSFCLYGLTSFGADELPGVAELVAAPLHDQG